MISQSKLSNHNWRKKRVWKEKDRSSSMLGLQQIYRNNLLILNTHKDQTMISQIEKKQILTSNHINPLIINHITRFIINRLISILKCSPSILLQYKRFRNHKKCLMDSLSNKITLLNKLRIAHGKQLNLHVVKQQ